MGGTSVVPSVIKDPVRTEEPFQKILDSLSCPQAEDPLCARNTPEWDRAMGSFTQSLSQNSLPNLGRQTIISTKLTD